MAYINSHYLKLQAGYLFPEIGRRVKAFQAAHPEAQVIRMGIGDVTEPLAPAVIAAMHRAVDEMARHETFRGYGPEQGYDFLRQAIAENDFRRRGCEISPDEVFVSDGCKCDCGNILDILAAGRNRIAVSDPVYPVYVDTNVMAGNTGPAKAGGEFKGLTYLRGTPRNGFMPLPPRGRKRLDVVYLCSPNNPTGAVATRPVLQAWVDFARAHDTLILFDAAYEAYITDPEVPHSIYEIPGAREVAIEFRSFSKTAGFTGVRCGFIVVPTSLTGRAGGAPDGARVELHRLWSRRHTTKFNGTPYVTQRAAEAVYSPEGRAQCQAVIRHYLDNAAIIRRELAALGLKVFGGVNAPYVWSSTPGGLKSWDFFDKLLSECHVVCTPGSGFGAAGEGYVRLSAFNSRANVEEAMGRLRTRLKA